MLHHEAHAAYGFYDSPFDSALVVTADGGGWDGVFNVYHANRTAGPTFVRAFAMDLGYLYAVFSRTRQTASPADLMALAAFGAVQPKWRQTIAQAVAGGQGKGARFNWHRYIEGAAKRIAGPVGPQAPHFAAALQDFLEVCPNAPVCRHQLCMLSLERLVDGAFVS